MDWLRCLQRNTLVTVTLQSSFQCKQNTSESNSWNWHTVFKYSSCFELNPRAVGLTKQSRCQEWNQDFYPFLYRASFCPVAQCFSVLHHAISKSYETDIFYHSFIFWMFFVSLSYTEGEMFRICMCKAMLSTVAPQPEGSWFEPTVCPLLMLVLSRGS